MGVSALALGVGVRDDDVDPGEELAGLHEGQAVGSTPFGQGHPIVPQGAEVDVHGRRVRGTGTLERIVKL